MLDERYVSYSVKPQEKQVFLYVVLNSLNSGIELGAGWGRWNLGVRFLKNPVIRVYIYRCEDLPKLLEPETDLSKSEFARVQVRRMFLDIADQDEGFVH